MATFPRCHPRQGQEVAATDVGEPHNASPRRQEVEMRAQPGRRARVTGDPDPVCHVQKHEGWLGHQAHVHQRCGATHEAYPQQTSCGATPAWRNSRAYSSSASVRLI
jgi:hypothetical protein